MPLKAKRGFTEWAALIIVLLTLMSLPQWVRGVVGMVRKDHWAWLFVPFLIGIGYGWNSYLLKRWWNPAAYKIRW